MRQQRLRRRRRLFLLGESMYLRIVWSLFLAIFVASACASNLDAFGEGRACENGACLSGFVCDKTRNACVRPSAHRADGGPVACGEGETNCGGHCVELTTDPDNCSGCGA